MRASVALFVLSALTLVGSGPAVAQKEKEKELPPQNELALKFADNPGEFKGKVLTFKAQLTAGAGQLRERIGVPGSVPFYVYPPNSRQSKLLLGVSIPKGFKEADVPNVRGGEEVIVTFICGEGKASEGNKAVAFRRAE